MVHYFIKEFYRLDEEGRKKLFAVIAKALMWFSFVVSVLCFIGVLLYLKLFNADSELPVFPYLAMTVFSIPICGLYNLVQARYRIGREATAFFRLTTASGVISILLSLLFVVLIRWGAFGKLLAPLLGNISVFLYLFFRYRKEIFIPTESSEYTKILSFCWPLALSATLGYFTNGFDRTYLETLNDTTEYGYYVVGVSIAGYLSTFSTAVNNTFQPDLYQSVIAKEWSRYIKYVLVMLACVAVIVIAFIVLCPFIIDILTAGRYIASTPYAQIVGVSTFTSTLYFLINNYTITTNRPKLYLVTSVIGSVFIVVAMPMMVDRFKFVGGAWMTVLSFVLFSVINIMLLALSRKFSLLRQ